MSSLRDGQKPLRGAASAESQSRPMAHPDPKLAQSSRRMAHPVHRNPVSSLTARLMELLPNTRDPGIYGAVARFFSRLKPREQRRRELVAVLALLVAAAAVSASMPGGWAESATSSPSAGLAANVVSADTATAAPTADGTWWPAPTVYSVSTLPPPPVSPTLPPTPKPTPVPTKKPAAKVYTFVALGDSLTAWPSDAPWPSRLDAEDANLTLVNNAGVPGDLTGDMLARLNSDVFAYKPEVLFIMGGTNDLGHNVSQATTIANLKAIIVAANARGIRIDLMTIPPDAYPDMAAKIDSLNAAIVQLGNRYKLVVIDINTPLSTSTGVYVPKYTSDGLHFSELGAQVVANAIYNRIHRYGF
ncbi:MAG: GDSL-type esterase/lipase family protein [Candidatus Limnocylindrales bacterium]